MKILHRKQAKTKGNLITLYISQYSEKNIRTYINDIVRQYRPKMNIRCKNISTQELLTFIELYGLPEGYELSEELKNELNNRNLKV